MNTKHPITNQLFEPYGDKYIFEFPDDFYDYPEWIRILNILTQQKIKEAFNNLKVSTNLLVIDLPINPNTESIHYYSLSGIEQIVYSLFNGLNEKALDELKSSRNIILYATLSRSEFHTLPKLSLRLIIEGEFSETTIDKLAGRLINQMTIYLGGTGDIEYRKNLPILYALPELFPEPENLRLIKDLINHIGLSNRLNNFLVAGITELKPEHILESNIAFPDFEDIRYVEKKEKEIIDAFLAEIDEDIDDLDFT